MPNDPFIGTSLGSYEILEAIGEGGMARVYKGFHTELNRYAAIKVVNWGLQEDPEFTNRFRREAQSIASLRHPNIVQIFDFGKHASGYFMAMEFIDGSDLAVHLKNLQHDGELASTELISRIISEVAAALDYAHGQGVIHRDVKPSNVMINQDGQSILTDFGLVMLPAQSSQMTLGAGFGTPHYVAPEQAISAVAAVPASDIYSLGIILFEMVTGQVPFDDESPLSVALKHVSDLPPEPSELNPDVSPELEAVILKALSKDPADRYATATAFAEATKAALLPAAPAVTPVAAEAADGQTQRAIPISAPATPPPPSFMLPPWLRLALVGVLGGIVGAAGLLFFMAPPPGSSGLRATETAIAAALVVDAVTPTPTDSPTATATFTPEPTETPSPAPTETPVPSPTPTATETPTESPTPLPTETSTPLPTETPTLQPTETATATPIPLPIFTPTPEGLQGKILFKTDRAGFVEIYQMNADGSNQRPLENLSVYTQLQERLSFSPDSNNQILVRGDVQTDLWWINFGTGQELRVTSTGQPEYDAAWSPIDNHIAYVSEETGRGDIYVLNLSGSSIIRLTNNEQDFDKHPTWSPDGSKVAFWSDMSFNDKRQIWVVDLATRELTSLSDNPFNDWDPVWVWE
jgi:serine/threonine protein kinase